MQKIQMCAMDGEALPTEFIAQVILVQLRQLLLELQGKSGGKHHFLVFYFSKTERLRRLETCRMMQEGMEVEHTELQGCPGPLVTAQEIRKKGLEVNS